MLQNVAVLIPAFGKCIPGLIPTHRKSIPDLMFHNKISKTGVVTYTKSMKVDTVPLLISEKSILFPTPRGIIWKHSSITRAFLFTLHSSVQVSKL